MEDNITEYIEYYLLHDPIGNVEGAIKEYDTEKLQAAEDNGAIFIAVYNTGKREIVKAADIVEPEPVLRGVTLVQPVYVNNRLEAVCTVFDALEASISSETGITSISTLAATDGDTTPTFQEALASLKALVYGEDDADGDS